MPALDIRRFPALQPDPSLQVPGRRLDLDTVTSRASIDGDVPSVVKLSPDGSKVLYCKVDEENSHSDLWLVHAHKHIKILSAADLEPEDGAAELTEEEKELQEARRSWGSGITTFSWCENSHEVFIPQSGGVCFLFDLDSSKLEKIECGAGAIEVRLAPNCRYISFVRENNLFLMDVKTKDVTQVTNDGGLDLRNGLAEYVAQEEMDRYQGYWWSPDSSMIAFTKVDESRVDTLTRIEIDPQGSVSTVAFKYPKVGRPNVGISLHIYSLSTKATSLVPTDELDRVDYYLPRIKWLTDRHLGFMIQSRDQSKLLIRRAMLVDGDVVVLRDLSQESDTYINLPDDRDFGILEFPDHSVMYITSEIEDHRLLSFYKVTENGLDPLPTPCNGVKSIDHIVCLDVGAGVFDPVTFYIKGRDPSNPIETHVYAATYRYSLDGALDCSTVVKLTADGMTHMASGSETGGCLIIKSSSLMNPGQISLMDGKKRTGTLIFENKVQAGHPFSPFVSHWIVPEFGTIKANDGKDLIYKLWKPFREGEDVTGIKCPVLVYVYGGPHAQMCKNQWARNDIFLQYFAQNGFVVFCMDNRGQAGRGKSFETVMHRCMSKHEIDDQKAGVDFLRGLPYVDETKIGVYGHSYGGYMTLMLMFRAGTHFNVGVSGAPVIDWRLYDTHYTERYMGTPDNNDSGYEDGNVLNHISGFDDRTQDLLVYHGTADNNVLFENTVQLYKQLQNHDKLYESLDYPGIKHSMQGDGVKRHYYRSIIDFLFRKLTPRHRLRLQV